MFYSLWFGFSLLVNQFSWDYELHKSFTDFVFPLAGIGWLEWAGVRHFPCSRSVGSANTPQVKLRLVNFTWRQALLRRIEWPCVFQNGSFPLPSARSIRRFLFGIYLEDLVKFLEDNSQTFPHWAYRKSSITIYIFLLWSWFLRSFPPVRLCSGKPSFLVFICLSSLGSNGWPCAFSPLKDPRRFALFSLHNFLLLIRTEWWL